MKNRNIKILSLLIFSFTFFYLSPQICNADFTDINNHWANTQILKWIDNGMIKGYWDGSFQPDTAITRAEFIALVNRVFNYGNKSAIKFSDVTENDWFTADIEKAVNAGYINGYEDGTMHPDNPVTRQEAAKMLALAFDFDTEAVINNFKFTDSSAIDNWAVKYVDKLSSLGILKGNESGMFAPQSFLTRAEAVTMLDRLSGNVINQQNPEIEGKHYTNNVLINKPGVKLKNTVIEGSLYLTEGVNSGEISLENVTVTGSVYVQGCQVNTINFTKCTVGQLSISSAYSPAHVIATGLTADSIILKSSADINILNDSKINSININACSNVLVSDKSDIKVINISEKANNSVVYAKPGIKVNSNADSVTINNKQSGKGNFVTEAYDLDIIDIN